MALNKSNKSTPSSRSGYFPEITASAGKPSSFLLPVRIKVTPNTTIAPLSDGKRNPAKMLQPVLIKDLFASTKKNKPNSTITSVSTQKKRRTQKSTQPYLNTQSCYKTKHEEEDDSFFNRKSCGGNKVRRQLYQTLDTPHKSALENKENEIKPKKKLTRNIEEKAAKSTILQNKNRKSLLLPPNSIKNTFLRKSEGTSLKASGKVNIGSNRITLGKVSKGTKRITETEKVKNNGKKRNCAETEDEYATVTDISSPEIDENDKKKLLCNMKDNCTMTSPSIDRQVTPSKSLHSTSNYSKQLITDPLCSDMKDLNINKLQCNCTGKSKIVNDTDFDFTKICNLDYNGFMQLKSFFEQSIQACEDQALVFRQSIQACEDQASKLRQILNIVNNMFINSMAMTAATTITSTTISTTTTSETTTKLTVSRHENLDINEKCNVSSTIASNSDDSNVSNTTDTSPLAEKIDKITAKEQTKKTYVEDKLPIPIKIMVTESVLNDEAKEDSELLTEMARLSTIGEVSCEVDVSNKDEKDESENKENLNNSTMMLLTPTSPRTPKILHRRSTIGDSCDSQTRRRSARLAAKRASVSMYSNSPEKQDSFTMLENELNLAHEKQPSKSLPASPMKPPMTPGIVKQFDKRIQRPLKEYMALKMNGTFLMTPDVKRFQSCLEPSDTPHSRKSMSRKIFMELCDLYAESPESK